MPSPLDYLAFTTPSGHTFVDDVGGAGGTPLDATHLNPLRDDVVAYVEAHILNSGNTNQHATGTIFEVGGGGTVGETTAYENVLTTVYSQASINAMFRLLYRYIIGGTTNPASLTSMIATLLARPDVASLNLLSMGTLVGTATPNDTVNTVVKRGATNGEINLRALIMQQNGALPGGSTGVQTFKRIASQTAPFLYFQDENGAFLGQWGPFGGIIATQVALGGGAAGSTPFGITGATSQSVDVVSIKDVAALPHLRVTKDYWVVARDGLYTGSVGTEKQVIDASGNFIASLLTPRQFNEFAVVLNPAALTGTVAAGKYVDFNGAAVNYGGGTFPVNADSTRYVWWAITIGASGALHATANTVGGSTVAGSAIKANFLPSEKKVGYVLVPPNATTLAAATFDDWRGTDGPDGNAGAGGGVATTTTMITSADESATYTNSLQLAKVLRGGASVAGPTGLGGTLTGPFVIASDYTSNTDYGAALAPRLANDTSRDFEQQISVSGATITVTGGVNFPSWISTTFRWRQSTAAQSVTASGGAGMRYVFADLSGATTGTYTLVMSLTNTPASNQKLIAAGWFDGAVFQGLLDTSSVRKMQPLQYTPTRVIANASATALGANAGAGLTGGPILTIFAPAACLVDLDWQVNLVSAAIGWTQFVFTTQVNNSGSYSNLAPYIDFESIAATSQRYTIKSRYTGQLTAGRNDFRVGAAVATGAGPVPNVTTIQGFVYGS